MQIHVQKPYMTVQYGSEIGYTCLYMYRVVGFVVCYWPVCDGSGAACADLWAASDGTTCRDSPRPPNRCRLTTATISGLSLLTSAKLHNLFVLVAALHTDDIATQTNTNFKMPIENMSDRFISNFSTSKSGATKPSNLRIPGLFSYLYVRAAMDLSTYTSCNPWSLSSDVRVPPAVASCWQWAYSLS